MQRTDIAFLSQSDLCRGWLYRPEGPARAVLVMAHGLGAIRHMRLDAFAERFQAAGLACVVFDYRHFGDSDGTPRQWLSVKRQLQDWRAAIRWARRQPGLTQAPVVLWGTSFSGGHVIRLGATEPDIAAVMAQCPFTSGPASAMALSPISTLKMLPRALLDVWRQAWGQEPAYVPAAGMPHSGALMTAPDVMPGYLSLVPPDHPFPNRVAARFLFEILLQRPGAFARRLRCPGCFVVCMEDSVAPAATTLRHLERAPDPEIHRLDCGHFDPYVGEGFEQVVSLQLDFLQRRFPARS